MTSCHISLVKLKQYLSPFLCLISPCVPRKHATTFNRISFVHFLPPPLLFFTILFSAIRGSLNSSASCSAQQNLACMVFTLLKTLFESEECNLTIWYLFSPMNYLLLMEISIAQKVGEGVLMVKGSGQKRGQEKADKAEVMCPRRNCSSCDCRQT